MSDNTVNKTLKPVKINETVLRDAHQSLIATRMPTEIMLPIVDKMDKIGYNAIECWGGATFDACLRFLKEDPWERTVTFVPFASFAEAAKVVEGPVRTLVSLSVIQAE